jgi:predicted NBD/HSP70 family sugar kinase
MSTRTGGLAGLRTQNAREVLRVLLSDPEGQTQKAIQENCGLGHATVSDLLASLYHEQMVTRAEAQLGARGRPVHRWRVRGQTAYSIGVSINVHAATVLMVDLFGQQCGEVLSAELNDGLVNRHQTARMVARLLRSVVETPERCRRVAAVTVSLPGPIADVEQPGSESEDAEPQSVRRLIMRYWEPQPRPLINIENDANVTALAERWTSDGRRTTDFVYIKWDEELSGGLVLDDALWRGQTGGAGQIGHMKVRLDDERLALLGLTIGGQAWPMCPTCGQIDCLEVLVGGEHICARLGAGNLDEALSVARHAPDSLAAKLFGAGAGLIGRALGPTLGFLDVADVVLGGKVGGLLADQISDAFRVGVAESLQDTELLRVRGSRLGEEAAARGGALAALERNGVDFLLRRLVEAQDASDEA